MMKRWMPQSSLCCSLFWLAAVPALGSFIFPVAPAFANSELDQAYALQTIGFLKALDNVDGLFAEIVSSAYKDYFSRQSRFVLQDLSKAETVLSGSKLPYSKLIHDPEILSRVARATRSASIIRTTVIKEGSQYRFTLEWLHSPEMFALGTESFVMKELANPTSDQPLGLGDVHGTLQKALDRMIAKVPFVGMVTGRDNDSVTVNIGTNAHLKRGDTLMVATVEEARKHPLLRAIVDWRFAPTGRIEIDDVDEKISFGHVVEDEEGRKVGRYQKVTRILPLQKAESPAPGAPVEANASENLEPPRLGWVSGGIAIGSANRQYTIPGTTYSGNSLIIQPKAEGQIWLNPEWFAELALGYGFWSYSQKEANSGNQTSAESVSSHLSTFRFDVGYSYLVTEDFFGPKGWVKLGFESNAYSFPVDATQYTAPITFKGLFLGFGGDLPVRDKWHALLNIDFGLFPSATEPEHFSGTVNSASFVGFYVGASYQYAPRLSFRAGLDIAAQSADFANSVSVSQKVVTISPALVYSF